jgi:oxygen-independent coproporphyrinogen-3 oxidase
MLSLYIHIPFCVAKCSYCGFYSSPYRSRTSDAFIDALAREAAQQSPVFGSETFQTVYFGGGTPSVLTAEQFVRVVRTVRDNFRIDKDAEITLEANPNTVESAKLETYQAQGVNRLSIGVQSFHDDELQFLGRPHTSAHARDAIRLARDAGFRNISIDLIYGLRIQSRASWLRTVEASVLLRPEHISLYALSLDAGSAFARERAQADPLLDDDAAADLYDAGMAQLASAGYLRYEISNTALPGFACRHNENYWARGEYLGLGPAAWSFRSGCRRKNISDTETYAAALAAARTAVDFEETPTADEAARETIALGLRTLRGLDLAAYEQAFGGQRSVILRARMKPLEERGLLRVSGGIARLENSGFLLSNEALSALID